MNKRLSFILFASFVAFQLQANPISKSEARIVAQEFININDDTEDDADIAPYYVQNRFPFSFRQSPCKPAGSPADNPARAEPTRSGSVKSEGKPLSLKENLFLLFAAGVPVPSCIMPAARHNRYGLLLPGAAVRICNR